MKTNKNSTINYNGQKRETNKLCNITYLDRGKKQQGFSLMFNSIAPPCLRIFHKLIKLQ